MPRKKKPTNEPTVIKQRESLQRWEVERILMAAETAYITDERRRSIAYWWEQLGAGKMQLTQMSDRATRGKWAVRRDKYWAGVTSEVLRRAKFQTVNLRMKELEEMARVRQNLLELVTPEVISDRKIFKVQPKSLEACMRALVAVSEHQDAMRDRVLAMVEPDLVAQEGVEGIQRQGTFEPEEMRKVARLLLEERRRKQLIEGDDDDNED